MIKSFRDADTERIFKREFAKGFPREIQQRAFMKLNAIDAAVRLEDPRLPSSNRLEALKGNRKGEHLLVSGSQHASKIAREYAECGADYLLHP